MLSIICREISITVIIGNVPGYSTCCGSCLASLRHYTPPEGVITHREQILRNNRILRKHPESLPVCPYHSFNSSVLLGPAQEAYDPGTGQTVANQDALLLFFGALREAELAVQKWGLDVFVELTRGTMANLAACDRCPPSPESLLRAYA